MIISEEEKNRIRGLHIQESKGKRITSVLKEEDIGGMTSDPRIMKKEYGNYRYETEKELSPTQQAVHDEVMAYIGQTFGSWMSPTSPPFSQEYAQSPYFDKLSHGIRDIIINNVE